MQAVRIFRSAAEKRGENGDTARDDDDLYKSESLMKKADKFKSNYKDYYDDVKLHIKEDW